MRQNSTQIENKLEPKQIQNRNELLKNTHVQQQQKKKRVTT